MLRSIDMKISGIGKAININLGVGVVVDAIPTVIAGLLFLAVPTASTELLMVTDSLIVRALLIAAVVGTLYVDVFLAILVFLVVARIFLERNNRKLLDAKAVITNNSIRIDTVLPDQKGEIADSEAQVDRTVYSPEQAPAELEFLPMDESGDNTFATVGSDSINNKIVLQSTVEGSAAATSVFSNQVINPDISNNSA